MERVGTSLEMRRDDNPSGTRRVIDGVTFLKNRLPKQAAKPFIPPTQAVLATS